MEQCGKFQLLERLLTKLLARKHKVPENLFFLYDDECEDVNYYLFIFFHSTFSGITGFDIFAMDQDLGHNGLLF